MGKNKVNPIAMILSAKMMLDWLGEKDMAERAGAGRGRGHRRGQVRTYDMGGHATTLEMAEAIAARLPVATLK